MEEYQAIIGKLKNVSGPDHNGWSKALCPAHEDRTESLSLKIGDDGQLVVHCHAGCTFDEIRGAMGLDAQAFFPPKESRKIVATYDYRDENGTLLYQVVRFEPKGFLQRKPAAGGGWEWKLGDTRRVLYGLPELAAASPAKRVCFVEGEKDVESARKFDLIATCNAGGAMTKPDQWRTDYSTSLRGRHVIVVPDNDAPGRKHAEIVAAALASFAASVKVIELPGVPEGGDLTDWIASGGTKEKLRELVRSAKNVAVVGPSKADLDRQIREIERELEPRMKRWLELRESLSA